MGVIHTGGRLDNTHSVNIGVIHFILRLRRNVANVKSYVLLNVMDVMTDVMGVMTSVMDVMTSVTDVMGQTPYRGV